MSFLSFCTACTCDVAALFFSHIILMCTVTTSICNCMVVMINKITTAFEPSINHIGWNKVSFLSV